MISVYPVPALPDGRRARIFSGWNLRRDLGGPAGVHVHDAVDLAHPDLETPARPNTPAGSVPYLACDAGEVVAAVEHEVGWMLRIRHSWGDSLYVHGDGAPWVIVGQPVAAGAPLGIIGRDLRGARNPVHLHFKVFRGRPLRAFDPAPWLRRARLYRMDGAVSGTAVALALLR